MDCEELSGIKHPVFSDDFQLQFMADWEGVLPPSATRDELKVEMEKIFSERKLSDEQIEETLDFLEKYEARYYENSDGKCYHRSCKGSVGERCGKVFCSNCGRLSDLLPPEFMR